MAALRIGLLGAARITPMALIQPARVIPAVEVTAIAARERDRADAFAARHGINGVFDDYDALIESDAVDLVYNALPIDAHAQRSIAALKAGKHVLCEKPLAMHAGEAHAMLAAAEAGGARLIEAFHYRYHPAFRTCLDWISSGRIGEVESIEASFHVTIPDNGTEIRHRPERGGGAMMDLGCYPLNWTLEVIDSAPVQVEASATTTPAGVDESMRAHLVFANGARARLSADMSANAGRSAALTIEGSEGRIDFVNPLAPHIGARLSLQTGRVREEATISPISTYTWQLAALVDGLGSGAPLPSEGTRLLRQQECLDAIYDAAGLGHLRRPTPGDS